MDWQDEQQLGQVESSKWTGDFCWGQQEVSRSRRVASGAGGVLLLDDASVVGRMGFVVPRMLGCLGSGEATRGLGAMVRGACGPAGRYLRRNLFGRLRLLDP